MKTENLRRDKEPETFDAIRYGTTAENICCTRDGVADYSNTSITANGRVGYPLEYVPTAQASGLSTPRISPFDRQRFWCFTPVALLVLRAVCFILPAASRAKYRAPKKALRH